MLPGNVDPRRPDKVQRYKAPQTASNGQGEDLTPDYMNILGQQQATSGNAAESADITTTETKVDESTPPATTSSNVIPTSPQYGVAIMSTTAPTIAPPPTAGAITVATVEPQDTIVTETKSEDTKDLQSTPSRNERFKVVKIASLEPFKRGRWKCMDYVDEVPPPSSQNAKPAVQGQVYLQTQSMPPQQIQQMLIQGGYSNGGQFFPNVPPGQIIPQTQYFYQANAQPNMVPAQFVNQQQYFAQQNAAQGYSMPPQGFQNVQYVPANVLPNQTSAFVPTAAVQLPVNFQQSQSYSGQPSPMVNGHAYPNQTNVAPPVEQLPAHATKSVILSAQPQGTQSQILQQQNVQQNQMQMQQNNVQQSVVHNQQFQQQNQFQQQMQHQQQQGQGQQQLQQHTQNILQVNAQSQNFDQNMASNVYTNPQFAMSVNSLTRLDNQDVSQENINPESSQSNAEPVNESSDDPAKTNPVVNAIDNKIEQAMDLVKSHLMYTVREEVEVLKEKIAELMERIQQLETENNYLRSQIPKNQPLNIPVASVPSGGVPLATSGSSTVNQQVGNTVPVNASQSAGAATSLNMSNPTELQQ